MTPEQLREIRWLKSQPFPLEFDRNSIDLENGILPDVVMLQEGEAKGHGFHMEAEFVNDLVAYDQKHYGKRGLKNRFGHPGASDDTMGKQMGYFRNFRTREKGGKMQAIADLHLLEAADFSPTNPNMREWMLRMAEEAPDFVMQSIVFRPGRYYQKAKDGKKKYVYEYTKVKGDDGETYDEWVSADPALGNVYIEFGDRGQHFYTDTVEAGAATDSLFSTEANPHLLVSKALSWLDEHPELKEFALLHPEKVQDFLRSLGIETPKHQPRKTLTMTLKELLFGKDKPAEDVALTPEEVEQLRQKLTDAEKALSTATASLKTAEDSVASLQKEVEALKGTVKERDDKVAELQSKIPAAPRTEGPKDTPLEDNDKGGKAHLSDPVTQTAMERWKARQPAEQS